MQIYKKTLTEASKFIFEMPEVFKYSWKSLTKCQNTSHVYKNSLNMPAVFRIILEISEIYKYAWKSLQYFFKLLDVSRSFLKWPEVSTTNLKIPEASRE